jgi:hypothetical protein
MSVAIERSISSYNKVLTTALEKIKEIYSGYVCKDPEWLRNTYDGTRRAFEKKTIEINEGKDLINKCINNLENCKNLLSEIENVSKEIIDTSNKGMVGTLFGLCKQTIKENKIPMNEIEETVFGFPYDEKDEIEKFYNSIKNIQVKEVGNNVGGKNNTKRKNYRAKNVNNKKSKKRRLKCKKV